MNRRLGAIVFFGLVALAEIGDLVGLVITLGDPTAAAAQLGISVRAETIRAIILLALALLIVLNSVVALVGALVRNALMVQFGALMAGAGLGLYGVYQIGSALLQHGQLVFAGVGAIYVLLGFVAFWLARARLVHPASLARSQMDPN